MEGRVCALRPTCSDVTEGERLRDGVARGLGSVFSTDWRSVSVACMELLPDFFLMISLFHIVQQALGRLPVKMSGICIKESERERERVRERKRPKLRKKVCVCVRHARRLVVYCSAISVCHVYTKVGQSLFECVCVCVC